MEKLNVQVGLVFTQAMFCDGQGKLQFHRAMTDLDKPWVSIQEVLEMVKQSVDDVIESLHIEFEFKEVNYMRVLNSLRDELDYYMEEGCPISIRNGVQNDDTKGGENMERGYAELVEKEDLGSTFYMEGMIFSLYRQDCASAVEYPTIEHETALRGKFAFKRQLAAPTITGHEFHILKKGSMYGRGSPRNYHSRDQCAHGNSFIADG
ncbi:hypothetical protein [Ammoniphilus sp. YIM 78166]|uniref:hypothetical protein n=1 Tax=Ammoniphilus sp. YIM 78166 TaxID=1644106 RepID=UPI00106FEC0A|nr:hypothetical protein [Ammoniphilus sp. YIM 78166]